MYVGTVTVGISAESFRVFVAKKGTSALTFCLFLRKKVSVTSFM